MEMKVFAYNYQKCGGTSEWKATIRMESADRVTEFDIRADTEKELRVIATMVAQSLEITMKD